MNNLSNKALLNFKKEHVCKKLPPDAITNLGGPA
jgi:hypothetical protein